MTEKREKIYLQIKKGISEEKELHNWRKSVGLLPSVQKENIE